MDDRRFLHEGEALLVNMHAAGSQLIVSFVRGILDALVIAIVASLLAVAGWWFALGETAPWWLYATLFAVALLGVWMRRFRLWKHASFRVTTERILIEHHDSIFTHPLHTVKWPQFQESLLGRRTIVDFFFGVRPVCVRYGTADAHHEVCFPALHYAHDLKHFLDKVDSAYRHGDVSVLKPFIAKPRGRRAP